MAKTRHITYQARRGQYDRIRHALEGQDAMRDNATLYLRRADGLTQNDWANYLKGAHYYPVADTTLRSMIGLAFRKKPKIEVPTILEPMTEFASFTGDSIEVLSEQLLREILSIGRVCAVLDFPREDNTSTTTPYVSVFDAEAIYDWRMGIVGGVKRLTYLRLHEDNEDLEDNLEQHLVLSLEPHLVVRRFHIFKNADGRTQELQIEDDIFPNVNNAPLFYIPAVIFSPENLNADVEKPPMLDLVDVNIAHFQSSADLSHALHMSALPTPVITGNLNESQKPDSVGPGTMWLLPKDATAFYLSAPSDSHASLRFDLHDKEDRMAALGARMILSGKRRAETAETASMRYQNDTAVLMSSINMLEAGMARLIGWAVDWVAPGQSFEVVFNKDLVSAQIDHQTVSALMKAWQSGAISHETFLDALRQGELITRSNEDEKDLIEIGSNIAVLDDAR